MLEVVLSQLEGCQGDLLHTHVHTLNTHIFSHLQKPAGIRNAKINILISLCFSEMVVLTWLRSNSNTLCDNKSDFMSCHFYIVSQNWDITDNITHIYDILSHNIDMMHSMCFPSVITSLVLLLTGGVFTGYDACLDVKQGTGCGRNGRDMFLPKSSKCPWIVPSNIFAQIIHCCASLDDK